MAFVISLSGLLQVNEVSLGLNFLPNTSTLVKMYVRHHLLQEAYLGSPSLFTYYMCFHHGIHLILRLFYVSVWLSA